MSRKNLSVFKACSFVLILLSLPVVCLLAQDGAKADPAKAKVAGPADPKAKKTYAEAFEWLKKGGKRPAIDDFLKANKQDSGHCADCLRQAYSVAFSIGDYKMAEQVAREWSNSAENKIDRAEAHYRIAVALQQQGILSKKDACFEESCAELRTALELEPRLTASHYNLGVSLAHLHQDDAARAEFAAFLEHDKQAPALHERAARYVERVELARARMAPPFSITTSDGQRVTMDSLAGKVVLIDFWATWCSPCLQALPHIKSIARQFAGQPLVIISISLDKDEDKWKNFVKSNQMTWLQYRDGYFDGNIAKLFAVNAIPATFTIDTDGVLEDQHVGDADIEGKLKKLVAHANQLASQKSAQSAAQLAN